MDFPCPEPVVAAMRRRLEHPVFGYTFPAPSLLRAVVDRLERRFGWRIRPEWVVITAGMVSALHTIIRTFTHPGDEVVLQPPVYYPFYRAVQNAGCRAIDNPLLLDGGRYRMDLAGLDAILRGSHRFPIRRARGRMLILCNPHNPVGRVWTPAELTALGEVCLAHGVAIVSDEIHADLVLEGVRHTVTASVSPALEQGSITLMSASKTFNLAGLDTSFAVIPRADWRHAFLANQEGHGANIFGLVALEAAFTAGDEYLERLLAYLSANMAYFIAEVERRIPALTVVRPEATYLAWVDMRALGLDPIALQSFIRTHARLAVDDGFAFGPGGEGFIRVNVACPRRVLARAVDQLERAVGERNAGRAGG
jgi:cystathionine beta-lyase